MSGPEPRTGAGAAALRVLRAEPGRAAVGLDFDGTLAPIVERPQDARPAPGATGALARLAGRVGRLAVISGRPAAEVVELGGFTGIDGLEVFGHYGLQRWAGGAVESPPPAPGVERARSDLAGLLAANRADPGVRVEDKVHAIAVHTRSAGEPEAEWARLADPLRGLAGASGLELVGGRLVWELRPPGVDKGDAVRALVAGSVPAAVLYAGDDAGDLPAFAAVRELTADTGAGICVAVASEGSSGELAERADLVLDGPAALVALLDSLAV